MKSKLIRKYAVDPEVEQREDSKHQMPRDCAAGLTTHAWVVKRHSCFSPPSSQSTRAEETDWEAERPAGSYERILTK